MSAFNLGLDLGQSNDYSALVVVERVFVLPRGVPLIEYLRRGDVAVGDGGWTEEFHVRAIRRWPLGTSYTQVVEDVVKVQATPALMNAQLIVDRSGVGRAVVDLFNDAWRAGRLGDWAPVPLTITGGTERGHLTVPKTDLVDGLLVPLSQGRVRTASSLALADKLEAELLAFQQSISTNGRTSYQIERREGQGHGDIAMALMLALAWPFRGRPEVVEHPSTPELQANPWRKDLP